MAKVKKAPAKAESRRTRSGGQDVGGRLGAAESDAISGSGSDPVSTIVAQWQRERPDIDPAPMLLFGLIARAQAMTTNFINDTLERWKLSRASFDVLAALRRAGAPYCLTPKQLSESLMLSGAGMTSRLDRLEGLLLVARLPEPNDRRSVKIQLTDRGVRLIDEMIPEIVAAQWDVASRLGPRDTEELIRLLGAFANSLAERP